MNTVLVVDDDKEIVDAIEIYLKNEGIGVIKAYDGIQAIQALMENEIHLILMDIMMPKMDGLRTTMRIREEKNIPIILISAKSEDTDKVLGLNMGADDYITKPFNPLELIARVKAALRRCVNEEKILDDLIINKDKMEVTYKGKVLELNNKEYQLLLYFVENPDVVLSRERLINAIWGYDYLGESRTIDNHILRLRKLGFSQIETIFGVGYKFRTK